jgi:hypothetical protein
MENAISDATFRWDKAADSLHAELTSRSYTVKVLLDVADSELEKRVEATYGEAPILDEKRADQFRKTSEKVLSDAKKFGAEAGAAVKQAALEMDNVQNRLRPEVWNNWNDARSVAMEAYRNEAKGMAPLAAQMAVPSEKFRTQLEGALNLLKLAKFEQRALTDSEVARITNLREIGTQLEENGQLTTNQLNNAVPATKSLFEAVKAYQAQAEATKRIPAKELQEEARQYLNSLEEGAKAATEAMGNAAEAGKDVSSSTRSASDSIGVANTNTNNWATGMNNVATAANNVAIAMAAAAEASQAAAIAASMVSLPNAAGMAFHGGPAVNYRAAGGMASRGQDTIPVMAAPDEFFMNARSSRRFASELQAMNAGREPIFRDKGGSVTNVGDINVSVTQGESANQTARQIASSLRRELRRGTSRL